MSLSLEDLGQRLLAGSGGAKAVLDGLCLLGLGLKV